jgi:hypothetical protein
MENRLLKRFPEQRADFASLSEFERRERIRGLLEQNLVRPNPRQPGTRGNPKKRPAFTPADFDELRAALSPKAREQFDKANELGERSQLMIAWIRQVYLRGPREPRIGEERLRKFFDDELSVSQQVELLRLPADQMQRQLRRLYHHRHPAPKDKRNPAGSDKPEADKR